MDKEIIELIGACIIAITQIYSLQGEHCPIFARMWDIIAKICGHLANAFGYWSILARTNYFVAVRTYGV